MLWDSVHTTLIDNLLKNPKINYPKQAKEFKDPNTSLPQHEKEMTLKH